MTQDMTRNQSKDNCLSKIQQKNLSLGMMSEHNIV